MTLLRAVLAAALALAAAPVLAQPPVAPPTMVGAWDLSKDGEGAPSCRITLGKDLTIGGFGVIVPKACNAVTRRAGDIAAWRMNGAAVVLADPIRRSIMGFNDDGHGTWSTGGPQFLLLTRPSHTLSRAERMTGHWRLVALGGRPCASST